MTVNIWMAKWTEDVIGYKVVANDGEIGHVHDATDEPGKAYLVIETGGWLLSKPTLVPAASVRDVNDESKTVQIDLTKDEIRNAPEYNPTTGPDDYVVQSALYYGTFGPRWLP